MIEQPSAHAPASSPAADAPLRILMVGTADITNATVKQALAFAQALVDAGHEISMSLVGDPGSVASERVTVPRGLELRFRQERGPVVSPRDLAAAKAFRPDVIHVLNPRHHAVHVARQFLRATGAAVVVHWEDDELGIREGVVKRTLVRRVGRKARRVLCYPLPAHGLFITPTSLKWIRAEADACDALTPALTESVHTEFGLPCETVFPLMMGDVDPLTVDVLDGRPELAAAQQITYTGSVHTESIDDFRLAVRATIQLREAGRDVCFVHAGVSAPRFALPVVAEQEGLAAEYVVELGYVPFAAVDSVLRQASVLVQPGRNDRFNRLRLPSKVQAYLRSGTPTVMFSVGLGDLLEDDREVLKLHDFTVDELATQIGRLLDDLAFAKAVGEGGQRAAARLFDPETAVAALTNCYRGAIAARAARSGR